MSDIYIKHHQWNGERRYLEFTHWSIVRPFVRQRQRSTDEGEIHREAVDLRRHISPSVIDGPVKYRTPKL